MEDVKNVETRERRRREGRGEVRYYGGFFLLMLLVLLSITHTHTYIHTHTNTHTHTHTHNNNNNNNNKNHKTQNYRQKKLISLANIFTTNLKQKLISK